ncbi:MAG: YlxR family protein [Actinomycetia bacterium]|nr:YlxR family protein [Actinomycetes bacterium]
MRRVVTTPNTRIAVPQRTCIGCRQTRPQSELVRCAVNQHGAQVGRTAAGRGAWLCSMTCYHTAVQRKAFDRSWKRSLPADALLSLGDSLRAAMNDTNLNDTNLNDTDLNDTDMKESSVVGIAPDNTTPRKG